MTNLPPLAALFARGSNMADGKKQKMERSAGGKNSGDAYDFLSRIEDETYRLLVDIDTEHKDQDEAKERITFMVTTVNYADQEGFDKWTLTEESHFYPDEEDPSDQQSNIILSLHQITLSQIAIQEMIGTRLGGHVEFSKSIANVIGNRIVERVTQGPTGGCIISTKQVSGAGEDYGTA